MKLELVTTTGSGRVLRDVVRVVIRDSRHHNPILLAIEWEPGVLICSKVGDPDFHDLLKECGVLDTAVLESVAPSLITVE